MKIKANGKLNLFLNIEKKLENGYHNLETLVIPIDLHDTIYVEPTIKNVIEITTNNSFVPTDKNNILYRCAELLKNKFQINDGIKIHLNKQIPLSGGLGGESTDAAALMHFYNDFYNLKFSQSDIFNYGRILSWDVPICYQNKCMYISDDKDICKGITVNSKYYILIVQPDFGILTKDAFKEIDRLELSLVSPQKLIYELVHGLPINQGLYNCFIYSNEKTLYEYNRLHEYSKKLGFDSVSMSGTGSCFFLVTNSYDIAEKGYKELSCIYRYAKITNNINYKNGILL